ncbi:MAG: RNA pyrophosphohydrolase [Sphingobacteriia bacterium]|nr:RNA pyrophosphohydrolase [Sphingobacteriia bacterium]
MITNKEGKVFVGKRIDTKTDSWQMPQGGIDESETPEEAAYRELYEETGIKTAKIIAKSKIWFYYDLPDYLMTRLWDGKYRGQKQLWFLIKFEGSDDEIDLQKEVPEFSDWKWVNVDELPEIIVPFKRKLYLEIIEEFKNILEEVKLN